MLHLDHIKSVAHSVGFDLCGVAPCRVFAEDSRFLESGLERGYGSGLDYLSRNGDKRCDCTKLVEGAASVIVCGVAYKNSFSSGYSAECQQKIASYALTTDYHTTIKQMLRDMCAALKQHYPTLSGRCFSDSAPVFEKRYAVEAGLGWIGRQSLLITPTFGSFVLLGVAIINAPCDHYDSPYTANGCHNCHRCVEACPNNAIIERHIDTRRCISCATVEGRTTTPLHGWIFGCDICSSVCPYNAAAPAATNSAFAPTFNPVEVDWNKMSEAEFNSHFAHTPLSRTSLEALKQRVAQNITYCRESNS